MLSNGEPWYFLSHTVPLWKIPIAFLPLATLAFLLGYYAFNGGWNQRSITITVGASMGVLAVVAASGLLPL